MRLNRGDRIAGVDGVQLRNYFRRFGSAYVNYATVMKEFSVTRREAQNILEELLKLEMICLCELQGKGEMVSYQTTMKGNALGMAKASRPITRASAERVLGELVDRVLAVNDRSELAYRVESVIVFGSYLSRAERLNDLDIAVELKARRDDEASFKSLRNASMERALASGRRFRNVVEEVGWPQIEVFSILKNRSRTISFCEWKSLFEMEGFRYGVVFGDKKRIVGLLKGGQVVESAENAKG
jgi:predicted nucleotidyltransferase